jgi:hypothetical protein
MLYYVYSKGQTKQTLEALHMTNSVMTFNERYFNLVEDKKELQEQLDKASRFYFDEAQWYMDALTLFALEGELKRMREEIALINKNLENMREGLSREQLKTMKVEYKLWLERNDF